MLRTLRQPRYMTFGALMVVVALVCIAAGTWQIVRFEQKRHANDYLRRNAHAATTEIGTVLPLVGAGRAPSRTDVEFRRVRVTGTYDASGETLVRSRKDGDDAGFLVVTPLRTADATLLVVRGFLAQPASGRVPVPATPPTGTVTVTAGTQPPETRDDAAGQLGEGQVESINPRQQAESLGGTVYDGYAQLESGQPGTRGLRALSGPDLSNPAGGALEPQHFAYVIQWYLFALLALAAPLAMARAETKHQREREFDAEPENVAEQTPAEARAARLADRYGVRR